jgi:hypothetical protein
MIAAAQAINAPIIVAREDYEKMLQCLQLLLNPVQYEI